MFIIYVRIILCFSFIFHKAEELVKKVVESHKEDEFVIKEAAPKSGKNVTFSNTKEVNSIDCSSNVKEVETNDLVSANLGPALSEKIDVDVLNSPDISIASNNISTISDSIETCIVDEQCNKSSKSHKSKPASKTKTSSVSQKITPANRSKSSSFSILKPRHQMSVPESIRDKHLSEPYPQPCLIHR